MFRVESHENNIPPKRFDWGNGLSKKICQSFRRMPERMWQDKTMRLSLRKEPEMAYKKPEIVAKSPAKQSFVAGCPAKTDGTACSSVTGSQAGKCMINHVK